MWKKIFTTWNFQKFCRSLSKLNFTIRKINYAQVDRIGIQVYQSFLLYKPIKVFYSTNSSTFFSSSKHVVKVSKYRCKKQDKKVYTGAFRVPLYCALRERVLMLPNNFATGIKSCSSVCTNKPSHPPALDPAEESLGRARDGGGIIVCLRIVTSLSGKLQITRQECCCCCRLH